LQVRFQRLALPVAEGEAELAGQPPLARMLLVWICAPSTLPAAQQSYEHHGEADGSEPRPSHQRQLNGMQQGDL